MTLQKGPWRALDAWLLVAASVLAIGAVVMLFDLNKELATSQSMFNDDLPSFSVRAEVDLVMLVSKVNEFINDESELDEMLERYEVLIGRLFHYESAFLTEFTHPDPIFHATLEELKTKVLDLEERFYALRGGDVPEAIVLRDELKDMRGHLAKLSDLTRQHQFLKYSKIEKSLAHSVLVGTLMLASTLILVALTLGRFWYSIRVKTRISEELEAKVQSRTQDLQLSNNELKNEIAERQKAEKSLAERDQQMHRLQKMEAVGRITAGVAHDFNNLLAVIMGNIELQMNLDQNHQSEKYLDNALTASLMGSQLTRKLLTFGRRSPLKPEIVNLNTIASELDDFFMQTITEKNVLETSLAENLRLVSVDRSLLENVLLNLVINARDALPDGGLITIATRNVHLDSSLSAGDGREIPPGDYVEMSVSDSGSGMTAEVLEKAIEPFFTTKPESQGSGLGLSMAYGFVQQSNGQIQVASKPNQGTSVRMIFPICTEKQRSSENAVRAVAYQSAKHIHKVLVAEDSEAVRKTVVEQLQLLGCEAVEANSGQEAYDIIREGNGIDLLLTDVVMPGSLQGPDLAKQVQLLKPDIKIVLMSGYPGDMDQSMDGPNSGFTKLMKPISLALLSQTMRNEFEVDLIT